VARSADIHATAAACPESLGEIEPMARGALDWLITIPADGSLPFDGCAPALIQWHTDRHPALGMAETGCTLAQLEIFHPDAERLSRILSGIGFDGNATVSVAEKPALRARILTPYGARYL
jgi:hypothetical protein